MAGLSQFRRANWFAHALCRMLESTVSSTLKKIIMPRMDLAAKLHQKPVVQRIADLDWMKGGSKGPYVVELDPTTVCDLACPGCISGKLLNKHRFSPERLLKLAEEFVEIGVKAVILIGGGEPLTHPAVGQLMEFLGKNDVHIGITTNGTLIDKYLDVIAEYSSWTRVSVDAATDATFLHLRPNRNGISKFNVVISNMESLAKRKKGILGFSFLIRTRADGDNPAVAGLDKFGYITMSNISEIYAAAKLAKEIGCDYFEPKPSYDDNHYLVTHRKEDMERAREQIEKAKALEDDHFHILESINLEHSLRSAQMGPQPKDYHFCPASDLRTLVTASGVYVCPYFRGREDKKLGDVITTSMKEMWEGEQRKEVMKKLDPSQDCGMHCIRHEMNLKMIEIRKELDEMKAVNIITPEREDRFI
jgi:MoaA/NifB/PqqE/SkfB family radical SAM enzyme